MRIALLGVGAILALGVTAADARDASPDGSPLKVRAPLDCPASQGSLTRVAQGPDGRYCDYRGEDGDWVRLQVMPLEGRSPAEALAPTRAELHALLPVYEPPGTMADDGRPGDRADIDLPFIHIKASGDRADVRLFGIRIRSEGRNADVDVGRGRKRSIVRVGANGVQVTADEIGRSNASLVYVLVANRGSPAGYRAVGYVAKGPVTGPLVVAEFRSPHDRHGVRDGDHIELDRLIDRNLER
jgi:hypothetical protein